MGTEYLACTENGVWTPAVYKIKKYESGMCGVGADTHQGSVGIDVDVLVVPLSHAAAPYRSQTMMVTVATATNVFDVHIAGDGLDRRHRAVVTRRRCRTAAATLASATGLAATAAVLLCGGNRLFDRLRSVVVSVEAKQL